MNWQYIKEKTEMISHFERIISLLRTSEFFLDHFLGIQCNKKLNKKKDKLCISDIAET